MLGKEIQLPSPDNQEMESYRKELKPLKNHETESLPESLFLKTETDTIK